MSLRKLILAALFCASATAAHAFPISSVIAYGDSLSDNGNLYRLITYPPSPYFNGRFSNGPVAVEQLAASLGVPLTDFAYGGATSGVGNYIDGGTQTSLGTNFLPQLQLPGITTVFNATISSIPRATLSSSLVIVFGGANDFFSSGDPAVAAANIDNIVKTLQTDGAQHILVPGLPDLGLTPEFYGNPVATGYSQLFNANLIAGLPSGAVYFDTYSFLHDIAARPSAYGLTDVTDPCFNGVIVCANPGQYLFFDGVHPTTAADAILARSFAAASGVTPEPSSIVLIGSGVAWVTALIRRRKTLA